MFSDILSNPEYKELIDSNPKTQQLLELLQDDYTMTMRKITHEIRNSLTMINSSLQIIESSHIEVKDFKYWSSTMEDVKYLIDFMSEISVLNNSGRLNISSIDIYDMLYSLKKSFSTLNQKINISIMCDDNIPPIKGDITKLRQVFINLLKNATEALANTKAPAIYINIFLNNSHLIIKILDNGPGIPKENISQIFNPMVSFKNGGTGLGLAISKNIIDAHKGTISVESTVNEGALFTVKLPVN